MIQSEPVEHGFWSDSAKFEEFMLMTSADGRRDKILPYQQHQTVLSVYDRSGRKRTVDTDTLSIAKFETDIFRNVVFMPVFENGFESFVAVAEASDLKPSDISRVEIKIKEGKPVKNPFKSEKKK